MSSPSELRKLVREALHFGHISAHVHGLMDLHIQSMQLQIYPLKIFWGAWYIIYKCSQICALKYLDYLKMFKASEVETLTDHFIW